jgi:hypothetical protein
MVSDPVTRDVVLPVLPVVDVLDLNQLMMYCELECDSGVLVGSYRSKSGLRRWRER